jgi:hypothetical protein
MWLPEVIQAIRYARASKEGLRVGRLAITPVFYGDPVMGQGFQPSHMGGGVVATLRF